MEQVSLPYRIALGALLVLALLWFTVLKPSDEVADPVLPGQAGLSTAVDGARAAAGTPASTPIAAAPGGSAPAPPATPSAAPKTLAPAEKPDDPRQGDPSKQPLAAVERGGVALVLFTKADGAEDQAVRDELRRFKGAKVTKRVVSIDQVAEYEALTSGVQISQAPTLLVIGKGRKARTIVGLTDRREIGQVVDDVQGRRSGRAQTLYGKRLAAVCRRALARGATEGLDQDAVPSRSEVEDSLGKIDRLVGELKAVKASPAQAGARRELATRLDRLSVTWRAFGESYLAAYGSGRTPQAAATQARAAMAADDAVDRVLVPLAGADCVE